MKQKFLLKTLLLLCALVVGSSSVWATTYKLTSVTSVSAGNKYVFVRNSHALSNTVSSKKLITTDSYSTTGLSGSEAYVWALETATEGFYLKNASLNSNQYLNNGSGTDMSFGAKSSIWSIAFTDGVAKISNKSNSDRFIGETSSGSNEYKAYAKGNESTYGNNFTVYVLEEEAAAAVATPTFSPAGGTYTSAQNVTLSCETTGADIYYTLDGTTPTGSSDKYISAINVSETKTIKAIAKKGSDYSNVASATYTIYPVLHAGTAGDPYTVADARNAIEANTGLTDVYVSGIVCEGGSELTSGAMNYWISDDGTETNKFEIYRGKGIGGADFEATSDVKEGDAVVVKGTIKKFGTVYEFESGSQLVSLTPSANPVITVTPSSLTGFTYGAGSGPSDAQTFSVEGSNLTASITLSLGVSNYEMSFSEGSGYTNSLTLNQTAGAVTATTIYVRLKAGLAIDASYEGTVTLTSTGATNKAVSLTGSVTQPNFTWNLATNSYSAASEDQVTWTDTHATMVADKGSSTTNANNYLPTTQSSSRFYKNSYLTIAPTSGYSITGIEFTATTEGYATSLKNSTWTNATAAVNEKLVTVTPTNGALPISTTIGGTCGFTAVKVYYGVVTSVPLTPAKTYTTLTSSHNLDFSSVSSVLEAYIVKDNDTSDGYVTLTQVNKVPAGTGLVLKATTLSSPVSVPVFDGTDPDDVSGNKMAGSATATTAVAKNAGYILSDGVFQPSSKGTLAAGKAYLNIAYSPSAPILSLDFGNEATNIADVRSKMEDVKGEVYNLNGQRVAQPTKGLYIVNGKKVVLH